jgi:hypothetical protein
MNNIFAAIDSLKRECAKKEKKTYSIAEKCRDKASTLEEKEEKLKGDNRFIGTEIFKSFVEAMVYYGAGYDEIKEKIAAKEISLEYPSELGHWDKDNRWHRHWHAKEISRLNKIQHTLSEIASVNFEKAFDFRKRMEYLDRCRATDKTIEIEAKSLAELKNKIYEVFKTPFAEELPYCYFGFPIYDKKDFLAEELKPQNNRRVVVKFKGRVIGWFFFLRNIVGPSGHRWGMGDGTPFAVILNDSLPVLFKTETWRHFEKEAKNKAVDKRAQPSSI